MHAAHPIILLAVLAACSSAKSPSEASAAEPTPSLTDTTYGGRLVVPDGFTVTDFAKVDGARFMALAPDGSVYVSQPRQGNVVRLVDANRDGVAETQVIAVSTLDRPHGLAFHDGWLYIANTGTIVRVRLGADGRAAGAPARVASIDAGGGHWTRTVIFGGDGAMYVSVGSTCNLCEESSPDRAAVLRFDADGGNRRVFARGLRNAVGLAVHPVTREIWATQHERDNIAPDHQDLPFEEINILKEGGDYGWPYCHGDRVPNPEYRDQARCDRTLAPALKMQAHSAPLGITFLDKATTFPAEFRGDALVAFHGSWNRDVPTGAKVVRIRVRDGRPESVEDFIAGWQDRQGRRWGRPVDVLVASDGALLVSDDASGTIYRVTHR